MNTTPYLVEISRLLIGFTLLAAAFGKFYTQKQFEVDLADSLQLAAKWSKVATCSLIMMELTLAMMILSNGELSYLAMVSALIMLGGFTLHILASLLQDKLIRCNCFGQSNDSISYFDVTRNLVLLGAAGFYLLCAQPHPAAYQIEILTQLMLAGVALTVLLFVTHLNEVALVNRNPKTS